MVQLLVEKGANIDFPAMTTNCTPLHAAVDYGHTDVVKLLLANGADIDFRNSTNCTPCTHPLYLSLVILNYLLKLSLLVHIACSHGHLEIICLLLKHGATMDFKTKWGDTALKLAPRRKRKDIGTRTFTDSIT